MELFIGLFLLFTFQVIQWCIEYFEEDSEFNY